MAPYQPCLPGEQFLHHTLFEGARLGQPLLQRLDLGIHVGEDGGDGGLFGHGGQDNRELRILVAVNAGLPASHGHQAHPIPICPGGCIRCQKAETRISGFGRTRIRNPANTNSPSRVLYMSRLSDLRGWTCKGRERTFRSVNRITEVKILNFHFLARNYIVVSLIPKGFVSPTPAGSCMVLRRFSGSSPSGPDSLLPSKESFPY